MRLPIPTYIVKRLQNALPERHIHIRSNGGDSYWVIPTYIQYLTIMLGSLILLWSLMNLISLLFGYHPFKSIDSEVRKYTQQYQSELEDTQTKLDYVQVELLRQQDKFTSYAQNFREKHALISELLQGSGMDSGTPPENLGQYVSHQVLMSPNMRDVIPRQARYDITIGTDFPKPSEFDISLKNLLVSQNLILRNAEKNTLERIEQRYSILNALNISAEDILQADTSGRGGIFVAPSDYDDTSEGTAEDSRMNGLKARMNEAKALDLAMLSIPFDFPVQGNFFYTSPYGKRSDPFTNRPAFHEGIDFGAYRLAPIIATAAGKIHYAGRRGGYGYVVEIDHGHGFMTRYAHLAKTSVKRGQSVNRGQKIGAMGSSGRSTSTHLHYEVHFQGQPHNPQNFFKARYFLQK